MSYKISKKFVMVRFFIFGNNILCYGVYLYDISTIVASLERKKKTLL